jgi:trigger factor
MGVQIAELEKSKVKLDIEVGPDELEKEIAQAFKRNMKRFAVPGFRKGKAPQNVVERYYGREILVPDALEALCQNAYGRAVEEKGLRPIDQPELDIDMGTVSRGEPVKFSMTVTVMPKAVLGKYKGIEVSEEKSYVTDSDIDDELKKLAERRARLVPVEDRPSQEGDSLLIDCEGRIDGEPFEGGKLDGHTIEIGKKTFIPGFEEQLVGKNVEDNVEVKATFPDDYREESLRGKDAVFAVSIRGIKKKELPEIDDEFAQDVSEFDTLAEYREDVRKRMQDEQERRAKDRVQDEVLDAVIGGMEVYLPEALVRRHTDYNFGQYTRMMGLSGEASFPENEAMISDELRPLYVSLRKGAERDLKIDIALGQIADDEGIGVDDAEVEEAARAMFEERGQNYDERKDAIPPGLLDSLKDDLRRKKTVDFLVASAAKS